MNSSVTDNLSELTNNELNILYALRVEGRELRYSPRRARWEFLDETTGLFKQLPWFCVDMPRSMVIAIIRGTILSSSTSTIETEKL